MDLQPCPHCKAASHRLTIADGQVVCMCGMRGPKFKSSDMDTATIAAVEGWNNLPRRVAEVDLPARAMLLRRRVLKSNIPNEPPFYDRTHIEAVLREYFILVPRLKAATEALNMSQEIVGKIFAEPVS